MNTLKLEVDKINDELPILTREDLGTLALNNPQYALIDIANALRETYLKGDFIIQKGTTI